MAPDDRRVLTVIGAFKLLKGVLLIMLAVDLHGRHQAWVLAGLQRLAADIHVDRDGDLGRAIQGVLALHGPRLEAVWAGTLFYAALFLAEGMGLLLKIRWAEYLTVVATGSLMPLEVFACLRRPDGFRIGLLLVNVWIVLYLISRIRRRLTQGTS